MTTLNANWIRHALTAPTAALCDRIDVFGEIDSTSTWLAKQPAPAPGHLQAAIADHQTNGRGRRDRRWISAPGSSLCLSVAYSFRTMPAKLPPLTLALGVGVVKALQGFGVQGLRLKWPNDLLIGDAKLGGILTETQFRTSCDVSVVAGIGINIGTPDEIANGIESDWTDRAIGLDGVMENPPSRDALAAPIIDAFLNAFLTYDERGFDVFRDDFVAVDWLTGRTVVVEAPGGLVAGIAHGIDDGGALLIDSESGMKSIVSGTIKHIERNQSDGNGVHA